MVALRRTSLLVTALLLLAGLTSAQDTQVYVVTPTPAPDGNGTLISFVNEPFDPPPDPGYGAVLNDAGQALFPGYLEGTSGGDSDYSGLYVHDGSTLTQIARAGQPSPSGNGTFYFFTHLRMPSMNNAGQVVYSHLLTDNDSGEFFDWEGLVLDANGGEPRSFLREDDPSPDGNGTIQSIFTPAINEAGQIWFAGEFDHPTDPLGTRGLFKGDLDTGELAVIAREDQVPPDGNGSFDLLSHGGLNEAGQAVLSATIDSDVLDDTGLYFVEADGSTMRKIVRVGDDLPGTDEVATFLITSGAHTPINDEGQVALTFVSAPCTNCPATAERVYRYDDGELVELAHTGGPSPDGGTYYAFGRRFDIATAPAINNQGQVAFAGETLRDDLIFTGIYRTDGTESVKVVDNGDPTPSGDGYFLFTSLCCPGWESNDVHKMNERGQIAFFTNLRDTPTVEDREGIFFYDDQLGVLKVARTNDMLLGSHIRKLRFTGQSSRASHNANSGLNNHGQVAYAFELADGRSGIAVWTPPATTTGTTPPDEAPAVFAIDSAYPNPFRDTATLRVSLPARDAVTLTVYDALGRRVIDRDLGVLGAGSHEIDVDGTGLAPGLYIARVSVEGGPAETLRLIKAE